MFIVGHSVSATQDMKVQSSVTVSSLLPTAETLEAVAHELAVSIGLFQIQAILMFYSQPFFCEIIYKIIVVKC